MPPLRTADLLKQAKAAELTSATFTGRLGHTPPAKLSRGYKDFSRWLMEFTKGTNGDHNIDPVWDFSVRNKLFGRAVIVIPEYTSVCGILNKIQQLTSKSHSILFLPGFKASLRTYAKALNNPDAVQTIFQAESFVTLAASAEAVGLSRRDIKVAKLMDLLFNHLFWERKRTLVGLIEIFHLILLDAEEEPEEQQEEESHLQYPKSCVLVPGPASEEESDLRYPESWVAAPGTGISYRSRPTNIPKPILPEDFATEHMWIDCLVSVDNLGDDHSPGGSETFTFYKAASTVNGARTTREIVARISQVTGAETRNLIRPEYSDKMVIRYLNGFRDFLGCYKYAIRYSEEAENIFSSNHFVPLSQSAKEAGLDEEDIKVAAFIDYLMDSFYWKGLKIVGFIIQMLEKSIIYIARKLAPWKDQNADKCSREIIQEKFEDVIMGWHIKDLVENTGPYFLWETQQYSAMDLGCEQF